MSYKASVPLLIFFLNDLSIDGSGVLKFSSIIVLLSVSPLMSVNVCFMYLGSPLWVHIIFSIVISSLIEPLIFI